MPRAYKFKELPKTCKSCGVAFLGHSNRKYCGTKCRDTSAEYLETRKKLRQSNLPYFLREKIKLAVCRGSYEVTITVQDLEEL